VKAKLDHELLARVDAYADEHGISRAEAIRALLVEGLDRENRPQRQHARTETPPRPGASTAPDSRYEKGYALFAHLADLEGIDKARRDMAIATAAADLDEWIVRYRAERPAGVVYRIWAWIDRKRVVPIGQTFATPTEAEDWARKLDVTEYRIEPEEE
jgi:hypothetical protein